MTVLNLQRFVVSYIRDISVREQFEADQTATLTSFDMTPREMEMIRATDMTMLQKTARHIFEERVDRRYQQFLSFCKLLHQCGLFEKFIEDFARKYPAGNLSRMEEERYMLEFGPAYIEEKQWPDVMKELLVLSGTIHRLSYDAKQSPDNSEPFDMDKPLAVKGPFIMLDFQYEVQMLTDNEAITSLDEAGQVPMRPHKLFLQKSYQQLLSCNIFEIDDPTFIELLQENLSGNELLARAASTEQKQEWEELLPDLYDQGVIGFAH